MQKPSKPIKTNLHRIELSLLPPNGQGMMPPGVQRFPFEFPIPGYLPTTLSIPGRLDIGYTVTATLRRSPLGGSDNHTSSWLDWTSFSNKSTLTASVCLQVVRAIESIPSLLGVGFLQQQQQQQELPVHFNQHASSASSSNNSSQNRMVLDRYFDLTRRGSVDNLLMNGDYNTSRPVSLSLDEQHDQLAYSMAGRSINNWNKPVKENEAGVRYELGIDRTAIAIGTSLGVHVHLEPQQQDIKIRSITARITETRDYTISVPSNNNSKGSTKDCVCKDTETLTMILKWAYGYPCDDSPRNSSGSDCDNGASKGKMAIQAAKQAITALSGKYRHPCIVNNQEERDNTPNETQQVPLSDQEGYHSDMLEKYPLSSSSPPDQTDHITQGKLLNLKFLNEKVHVGEYFDGWFVMPVPSCEHMLRPTMAHNSVTISHWLYLDVVLDCSNDKKTRKLTLGTPMRLLDCRLTLGASDDHTGDKQMILPPPPSYDEAVCGSRNKSNENNNDKNTTVVNSDHFWIQRWPITQDSVWGTTCSTQCPCKARKNNSSTTKQQNNQPSHQISIQQPSSRWQPEWGAPPTYTR